MSSYIIHHTDHTTAFGLFSALSNHVWGFSEADARHVYRNVCCRGRRPSRDEDNQNIEAMEALDFSKRFASTPCPKFPNVLQSEPVRTCPNLSEPVRTCEAQARPPQVDVVKRACQMAKKLALNLEAKCLEEARTGKRRR